MAYQNNASHYYFLFCYRITSRHNIIYDRSDALLWQLQTFQSGLPLEIGLMFVGVTYHALASLLKLQLMTTATVLWSIISRKVVMVKRPLMGLNALILVSFQGNVWAGDGKTKLNLAANEKQKEALNMIFSGKAGGFMYEIANLIGEVRGIEYAPIKFEIADDLSHWSTEIPGKVLAKAEALTRPTTPPDKRVQTINPPGSEVGPGGVATWKYLLLMRPTRWASNGKEKVGLANISRLAGVAHNR
jgi:hypothetical protein